MPARNTKFYKLLKRLQTKPMTYTQIKTFLSKGNYTGRPTNLYDTSLYGSYEREGLLRLCKRTWDGKYYVEPGTDIVNTPATPLRARFRADYVAPVTETY